MSAPRIIVVFCCCCSCYPWQCLGKMRRLVPSASATSGAAAETKAPQLEHFDPNLVDPALSPCDDFYKYSCNKWLKANPIPADQVFWSTGSGLELWNENVLRDTLVASSIVDRQAARCSRRLATTGPPAWTKAALKLPE